MGKKITTPDKDELLSVPVDPGSLNSCVGCYYYDEDNERCNDFEAHNCAGLIYIKKTKQ